MKSEYKILTMGVISLSMLSIILCVFWNSLLFVYPSTGYYTFYVKMDTFHEFWLEFYLFHGFGIIVIWFMIKAFKEIRPK